MMLKQNIESATIAKLAVKDFWQKAKQIDMASNDEIGTDFSVLCDLQNNSLNLNYRTESGESKSLLLGGTALAQLGVWCGVPNRYLVSCMERGKPALAQHNLNTWLADFDKPLLVRQYNDYARALLAPTYSICDTSTVLETLYSTQSVDLEKYVCIRNHVTPEQFHISIIEKEKIPVENEDLYCGFSVDTSDVGLRGINVCFFIYKQVCSNGLMITASSGVIVKQVHRGISRFEFEDKFSAAFEELKIMRESIIEKIRAAKGKKLTDEQLNNLLDRLKSEQLSSKKKNEKIFQTIKNNYDNSLWGYINGVTEVAQEYVVETQIDMEKSMGRLLLKAA